MRISSAIFLLYPSFTNFYIFFYSPFIVSFYFFFYASSTRLFCFLVFIGLGISFIKTMLSSFLTPISKRIALSWGYLLLYINFCLSTGICLIFYMCFFTSKNWITTNIYAAWLLDTNIEMVSFQRFYFYIHLSFSIL